MSWLRSNVAAFGSRNSGQVVSRWAAAPREATITAARRRLLALLTPAP
jgi:hypothetical protein